MGNDLSRDVDSCPDGHVGHFHKVLVGDLTEESIKSQYSSEEAALEGRTEAGLIREGSCAEPGPTEENILDGHYSIIAECRNIVDRSVDRAISVTDENKKRAAQTKTSSVHDGGSASGEALVTPASNTDVQCEAPHTVVDQSGQKEDQKCNPSVLTHFDTNTNELAGEGISEDNSKERNSGKKKDGIFKMFKFSKRNKDRVAEEVKTTLEEQIIQAKVVSEENILHSAGEKPSEDTDERIVVEKIISHGEEIGEEKVVRGVVSSVRAFDNDTYGNSDDTKLSVAENTEQTTKTDVADDNLKVSEITDSAKRKDGWDSSKDNISNRSLNVTNAHHDAQNVKAEVTGRPTEEPESVETLVQQKPGDQTKLKKKSWSFQLGSRKSTVSSSHSGEAAVSMDPDAKSETGVKQKRSKFSFKRFSLDRSSDSQATRKFDGTEQKPMKLKKIKAKKEKKGKGKKSPGVGIDDTDSRSDSFRYVPGIVDDDLNLDQNDAFDGVSLSSLSSQDGDLPVKVSINPKGGADSTSTENLIFQSSSSEKPETTLDAAGTDVADDAVYTTVQKDRSASLKQAALSLESKRDLKAERGTLQTASDIVKNGEPRNSCSNGGPSNDSFVEILRKSAAEPIDIKVIKFGNIHKQTPTGKEKIVAEFDGLKNGIVIPESDHIHDDSDAYVQLEELVKEFKNDDQVQGQDMANTLSSSTDSGTVSPNASDLQNVTSEGIVGIHRRGTCSGHCLGRVVILKDVGVQVPDVHTLSDVSMETTSNGSKEFASIGLQFPDNSDVAIKQNNAERNSEPTSHHVSVAYF